MDSTRRRHQFGLSLIELMVATVLGLIIIAALTQLFADVSRSNREMAKTNSQIESARFAMQFLRNDIVHAGYWGGFIPEFDDLLRDQIFPAPTDEPTIVPDPCLAFASWPDAITPGYFDALLGIPVQAYDASPSAACNAVVKDKLADTDLLLVRHAETCVAGAANCDAEVVGRLYFQTANCADEIDAGNPYALDPNDPALNRTERDCSTPAGKRRFIQNIYYIRDYAVTDGDGIPTLVRSEYDFSGGALGQQPAQALVQGIERFRVELGVDDVSETGEDITNASYNEKVEWLDPDDRVVAENRGDGLPDGAFVHCTTATPCTYQQLRQVVAVKLYVLARAEEPTPGYTDSKSYTLGGLAVGPFNDNFKRHVFSATVRINNVAGRRETP